MSTAAAQTDAPADPQSELYPFLVVLPDKTDPDTFARRLSVRGQHLARAETLWSSAYYRVGGALLSDESVGKKPEDRKMVGSAFVCMARSSEEVRKTVEEDVYYTSGVWDPERVQIYPFASAGPLPPVKLGQ